MDSLDVASTSLLSRLSSVWPAGVAKAIPIVGHVLSGGLTLSTFFPMSKRLQKHLASLELTKPGHRNEWAGIINPGLLYQAGEGTAPGHARSCAAPSGNVWISSPRVQGAQRS